MTINCFFIGHDWRALEFDSVRFMCKKCAKTRDDIYAAPGLDPR